MGLKGKTLNGFAVLYTRYKLGYGHVGSLFTIFNFAGILTLLFERTFEFDISQMLAIFIVGSIIGIVIYAQIVFKHGNMFSREAYAQGMLNDYWHFKPNPLNKKLFMELALALESNDFSIFKKKLRQERF